MADDASLTKKGHVQLSSDIDSIDETKAATPKAIKEVKDAIPKLNNAVTSTSIAEAATANAVKQVNDKVVIHIDDNEAHGIGNKSTLITTDKTTLVGAINEAFQLASDGKTAVADAITAMNVPASPTDTFPTLADKIGQIVTGKKFANGITNVKNDNKSFAVTGLDFIPRIIFIMADVTGAITALWASTDKTIPHNTGMAAGQYKITVTMAAAQGSFSITTDSNLNPYQYKWLAIE